MLRHPSTTSSATSFAAAAAFSGPAPRPKKRGGYNCGRCGQPKKGHVCPLSSSPTAGDGSVSFPPLPRSDPRLRRALSFDDEEVADITTAAKEEEDDLDFDENDNVGMPAASLTEVLLRLPPKELMVAAAVCRGWRDGVRRVWKAAEELRLRFGGPKSPLGFVGSLLHKCSSLARLTLRVESDVDGTVLACVAFSCPNLEAFEINVSGSSINRMTGDELGRFVTEKRRLSSLNIEGCSNLGHLNLFSPSLCTLWLSDLYCISRMVINCPNLKELSVDFSRQENDSTDLVSIMECLARTCPRLRNLHVASTRLSNEAVLALAGSNLRGLRMLSLILGSKLTDASVAAIVSYFVDLELLDLSGSSITDNGIGMICNAFSQSLSRLLLALCPNITSSGIQFATAQLPLLQLIDCGMSISDVNTLEGSVLSDIEVSGECQLSHKNINMKTNIVYQKLIIKHECLRKISLWGCSGLDALYLNCPELSDLNLNSCKNLHPERLLLQCPNLKNVHLYGCQDMLVGAIRNQISNKFAALQNHFSYKRLADGSKRVQVPQLMIQQDPYMDDDPKCKRARMTQSNLLL